MPVSTSFTTVSAGNGKACLEKCADSNTCKVASYSGTECQHSPTELSVLNGRMTHPSWNQYLKVNCGPASSITSKNIPKITSGDLQPSNRGMSTTQT